MALTNDQAEEMLRQLTAHYNEPVMPLKRFCDTMRQWVDCIEQGIRERPIGGRGQPDHQHGQEYVKQLRHILTDIAKSCLLGRMLYGGEKVRTVKCPEHNGHWVGIESDRNFCTHGCQFTGWLPEDSITPSG